MEVVYFLTPSLQKSKNQQEVIITFMPVHALEIMRECCFFNVASPAENSAWAGLEKQKQLRFLCCGHLPAKIWRATGAKMWSLLWPQTSTRSWGLGAKKSTPKKLRFCHRKIRTDGTKPSSNRSGKKLYAKFTNNQRFWRLQCMFSSPKLTGKL